VEIVLNRPFSEDDTDLVRALRENGDCTRGQVGVRDCPRFPGGEVLTAREAVAILMDRHGEALMRFLTGLLRDRQAAEDAFQDTWVRVMEKARTLRPGEPFGPWLFRVARNRAYDLLRRRRWQGAGGGAEPSAPPRQEGVVEADLRRERVARALAAVGPLQREVLVLRFHLERSYEEAAAALGIPLGTLKSRLKRAVEQFAEAYGREEKRP
jgi:RNA polymerase sigma-70 factor (ECF subfamily)